VNALDLLKSNHAAILKNIEMSETHATNYAAKSEEYKQDVIRLKKEAADMEEAIKRLA